jgi:hypothetical protein
MAPEKDENGNLCPFAGFKPCKKRKCRLYVRVRGMDPQTAEEIDHWDCALSWMPTLMIENSNMQRMTAASVNSFRNVMIDMNNESAKKIEEQNQRMLKDIENKAIEGQL